MQSPRRPPRSQRGNPPSWGWDTRRLGCGLPLPWAGLGCRPDVPRPAVRNRARPARAALAERRRGRDRRAPDGGAGAARHADGGRRREHHPVAVRPRGGGEAKVALLAHKDEIGGLVKRVEEGGRLVGQTLGDAHPWIWGEGPVEVLGRHDTVLGVLSFGARHVSDESPQRKQLDDTPVKWKDAWIETKLGAEALEAAGVTVGSRIVPRALAQAAGAAGRRRRVRGLPRARRQGRRCDAARAGRPAGRPDRPSTWCSRPARRSAARARSTTRAAPTPTRSWRSRWCRWPRSTRSSPAPTRCIIRGDAYGPLDDGLSCGAGRCRRRRGRDRAPRGRHALRIGRLDQPRQRPRRRARACLAAATENTHGFEIAHLDAIDGCVRILHNWLG